MAMNRPDNRYALESTLADHEGNDLERTSVHDFARRVRSRKLRSVLPQVIIKLDLMSRVRMDVAHRIELLRTLDEALGRIIDTLRTSTPQPAAAESGAPLSLEQRILCLMVKNYKQALFDIDRSSGALGDDKEHARQWAVAKLFDALGSQIASGYLSNRPLPRRTWLELHDLQAYVLRGRSAVSFDTVEADASDFHTDDQYIGHLLIGLLAELQPPERRSSAAIELRNDWARGSQLVAAEYGTGELYAFVVDPTADRAPIQPEGVFADDLIHGWILRPPPAFFEFLRGSKPKRNPFLESESELSTWKLGTPY